jgi:hypothetical protein
MPRASAHASISAVSFSDIFTALTASRAEVGRRIGWSGRFLGESGTFKSADHRNRLPLPFFAPDDLIPINDEARQSIGPRTHLQTLPYLDDFKFRTIPRQ